VEHVTAVPNVDQCQLTFVNIFAKYWPNLRNSLTGTLCKNFAIKLLLNIPPHLSCIATLDYLVKYVCLKCFFFCVPKCLFAITVSLSDIYILQGSAKCPTFHTQVVLVYLEWFRRNSFLKCVLQPKIAKNSIKTPIFGVQGRSRSSMLVPLESSSAVLAMIRSKSVSICNRFHARWATSGKITISKGVPLFDALVQGESPHPAAPILPY